ncbi:MAG: PRC-barrel domain-containing protein [Candidatus Anstonellales archaeon]
MKLSDLYGKEIFTDTGKFLGTVHEILIDMERGVIFRLLMEDLPSSAERARQVMNEKSIKFENVKSIADVVVVTVSSKT